MSDPVLPETEPTGTPIAYEDLRRGMLVEWRWHAGIADLAVKVGVRPLGYVVTREDVPAMYEGDSPLGIRTLDDDMWIFAPRPLLAKGGRLWAAGESALKP